MATGATIKAVEGFDKDGLKKAETTEKNPLPDKEGMYDRLLYWKMIQLFEIISNDFERLCAKSFIFPLFQLSQQKKNMNSSNLTLKDLTKENSENH